MKTVSSMLKRNIKLFFKDKGLFFTALITPIILLVLYSTFLGNVYKDALIQSAGEGVALSSKVIDGFAGAQLLSSILAVSPITVPFCANMLMVSDKVSGARRDLLLTPIKQSHLAVSYYLATFIVSVIICAVATVISLVYIAFVGWFFTFLDVLLIFTDVILLVMFGTALSSIINVFLSSQGQISAVGSIVSSGYGFISGAYMPISNFSEGLKNIVAFLPGTYGTSLIRSHSLRGVLSEMSALGVPKEAVKSIADTVDCTIYFFGTGVSTGITYLILSLSIIAFLGLFVLICKRKYKKSK